MESDRVVLISKTGSGKSSLANALFNTTEFQVGCGMLSSTKSCKSILSRLAGADTPGTMDVAADEEKAKTENRRAMELCMRACRVCLVLVDSHCDAQSKERNYTARELQSDMQRTEKASKEEKKVTKAMQITEQAKRKKAADWRRGSREPKVGRNQRVRVHRVQQPRRSN
ncbi:hypothetical protein BOX15_Mlig001629g2 [Macrostomum lignano]|uniref:AIG1-type G domain-containing protein n=1 Tax=Macrostomum lignano TaxID=282301 RepID=A0A267ERG5_9PLAT|nr:hypothetical protein BOX15_Mlig001629g2 [Macrostomum lignano]